MNDFDKGYVAGLLVGEGCFSGYTIKKTGKFYPAIVVKMNDDDMEPMQRLKELLGGNLTGPYFHDGRHFCIWQIRGPKATALIPLMKEILPPSRKRRQLIAWEEKILTCCT